MFVGFHEARLATYLRSSQLLVATSESKKTHEVMNDLRQQQTPVVEVNRHLREAIDFVLASRRSRSSVAGSTGCGRSQHQTDSS